MSDETPPTGWSAADEPTVAVPAVDGGGPPTEVHQLPTDDGEPPRRNGWIIAIILLLLAIVALLALLLLGDDDDEDDAADTTTSSLVDTNSSTTSSSTTSTTEATTTTTSAAVTTTTASTAPRVVSIETSEFTCPDPLTLSWTTENAVSVEVAIDSPGGLYDTGPANGSMEVPAPCDGDTQTYYVTAIASNGDRITQELRLES